MFTVQQMVERSFIREKMGEAARTFRPDSFPAIKELTYRLDRQPGGIRYVHGFALDLPAPWKGLRFCISDDSGCWQIDHFDTGRRFPLRIMTHPLTGRVWRYELSMEDCVRRLLYFLEAESSPEALVEFGAIQAAVQRRLGKAKQGGASEATTDEGETSTESADVANIPSSADDAVAENSLDELMEAEA